jgi:hypothetical protein
MELRESMPFRILLVVTLIICSAEFSSSQAASKLEPPSVLKLTNGGYELRLTRAQQEAVDQFLKNHPTLRLPAYREAADKNEEVTAYMQAGDEFFPKMQFPYAVWGDLNHDGLLDLAMAIVTKKPVNSYGWREWWLVVFQGGGGTYKPIVVTKEQNSCLAAMFYVEKENTVKYGCFPSGLGSFHWNGKAYVAEALEGD